MIILALETSCDETAAAVLCEERGLLSSEVASQIDLHAITGGVVPEVASRSHVTQLRPTLERALEQAGVALEEVDAIAATAGPGLATSLMIGMSAAKGLALGAGKPFISVNHLEGHLLSPFFEQGTVLPATGLVVSGGHTLLVDIRGAGEYHLLGQTMDDAAGEAFDKVGKLLGLPYPAGPVIDRLSRDGNPAAFAFPRSMLDSGDFRFSFSGLKTAVRYLLPKLSGSERIEDLCASFQEAVVDVLVGKSIAAAQATGRERIAISGGVSCNHRLRTKLTDAARQAGIEALFAAPALSTDNAAMIAFAALQQARKKVFTPLTADIDPNLRLV